MMSRAKYKMPKTNLEKYMNSIKLVMESERFHPEPDTDTETDTNTSTSFDIYLSKLRTHQSTLLNNISTSHTSINVANSSLMYSSLINMANDCLDILTKNNKNNLRKEDIIENNRILFEKKNKDYGNSFEDFAIIGIIVRLNDKINRILNLSKSETKELVVDESIEDTINDLYNYCMIGLIYK